MQTFWCRQLCEKCLYRARECLKSSYFSDTFSCNLFIEPSIQRLFYNTLKLNPFRTKAVSSELHVKLFNF